MKRLRIATGLFAAAAVFFSAAGLNGANRNLRSDEKNDLVVPGKVVVKVRPGALAGATLPKSGIAAPGLRIAGARSVARTFPQAVTPVGKAGLDAPPDLSLIYTIEIAPSSSPVEAARLLTLHPWVEYAEPRYYHHIDDVPNDPGLTFQMDPLTRLNLFGAWSVAKGSSSVTIATVDGGTYWAHEDLSPNLWINAAEDLNGNGRYDTAAAPTGDRDGIDQDGNGMVDDVIGWNFPAGSGNPIGLFAQFTNAAHGTATASHSSAVTNNGIGMAGTSWNCRLMPINAAGSFDNVIEFGAEGIEYASRMGAKVINCSFGRTGSFSRFEQEIIDAATARGSLVVAAGGNDNQNCDLIPHYPSNYRNVLAVGATASIDDSRASFSNYGVNIPVYAPGVNIWSARTDGGYSNGGSGTSYSSPLVAGIAGLLFSAHPAWTPNAVAAQLRMTADSIDGVAGNAAVSGMVGRGRVNAARALTESHAGLDVVASTIATPSGRELLIKGDSVLISVTLRNVLPSTATNVQLRIDGLDPALELFRGTASVSSIPPGGEATPLPFVFHVGTLDASREVVAKLTWVMNGNERDAHAFRFVLFPGIPHWLTQESPTGLSLFSVKAVDTSVVWSSGGDGGGGAPVVIRTTDGGVTWTDVSGDLVGEDFYCIEAVSADRAWVGSGTGKIFATTDGGAHWVQQGYGGSQAPFIDGIRFFDNLNGFALGDPAAGTTQFVLLKTTDGGGNWSHLTSEPGGLPGEAGWNNGWTWTDANHGWIGTNKSRIWRTTDGGATWLSSSTPGANCYGLAFRDGLTGVAGFEAGIIARSNDGGATWTAGSSPLEANCSGVAFPRGISRAWVSAGVKIGTSPDAGATWGTEITSPVAGGVTHISFADTTRGWGVTSAGEIVRYSEELTHIEPPVPVRYVLEQNYPNPFNLSTTIRFDLPEDARVEIVLYDLLGRRVRSIVERNYGPSQHAVVFDAAGIASGVYFYRLSATAADGRMLFTSVKPMVLIR